MTIWIFVRQRYFRNRDQFSATTRVTAINARRVAKIPTSSARNSQFAGLRALGLLPPWLALLHGQLSTSALKILVTSLALLPPSSGPRVSDFNGADCELMGHRLSKPI